MICTYRIGKDKEGSGS